MAASNSRSSPPAKSTGLDLTAGSKRSWRRLSAAALTFGLLGATQVDCTVIASNEIKGSGLGTTCSATSDCHAGVCDDGICVASCTSNAECPTPTACYGGKCQLPLKVAVLHVGVIAGGEGWTLTHQQGLEKMVEKLPYVNWDTTKRFEYRENVIGPDTIKIVDELIKNGAQVIIGNSFSQREELKTLATKYPNVKFLNCASAFSNGTNLGSYIGRSEQSWYIAGRVAARKTKKNRLGIVGSFITPESVRHINAFTLGARAEDPKNVVEVQWNGFWYDYNEKPTFEYTKADGTKIKLYREEFLTQRLIDGGADVIAHLADNQRPVRYIEKLTLDGTIKDVFSLTNDNRNAFVDLSTKAPLKSCIGGAFWNWAPQYERLLSEIHRGVWKPKKDLIDTMTLDPETSIVGFELNPSPTIGIDDSAVRTLVTNTVNAGSPFIFKGPYDTTGQRDKDNDGKNDTAQNVAAGETLSDDEWFRMCWFTKGVVEKTRRSDSKRDASNPDRDAKVPVIDATATGEDVPEMAAPDVIGPPAAPPRVALNCRKNL